MKIIDKTTNLSKRIFILSSTLFLAAVQIYLIALSCGLDWFSFSSVENSPVRFLLSVLVQIVLFATAYSIIYFCVDKIFSAIWIHNNHKLWIEGVWLHIHIKNKIRIGKVEMSQDFYDVRARGLNIDPVVGGNETYWSYYMAKVRDDITPEDFIGWYAAKKTDSGVHNNGIHLLTFNYDNNDFPHEMHGHFRDTFQITNDSVSDTDISEHIGRLILFRPSKECLDYLTDGNSFDLDKLKTLHLNLSFQNEPYVHELNRILDERRSRV